MPEPSDAMKVKARKWIVDQIHEDYLHYADCPKVASLATLLAEVQEEERLRISRHPALVCCHEAARLPEPERFGLCYMCEDLSLNIKAEGAREEREAVVKWLRQHSFPRIVIPIQRGDHLKCEARRKVLSQKLCGCDATGDCMEHSK